MGDTEIIFQFVVQKDKNDATFENIGLLSVQSVIS